MWQQSEATRHGPPTSTGGRRKRCKTSAGDPGQIAITRRDYMRLLTKRPALFLWATAVALFLAHAAHHGGGRGFHEW